MSQRNAPPIPPPLPASQESGRQSLGANGPQSREYSYVPTPTSSFNTAELAEAAAKAAQSDEASGMPVPLTTMSNMLPPGSPRPPPVPPMRHSVPVPPPVGPPPSFAKRGAAPARTPPVLERTASAFVEHA